MARRNRLPRAAGALALLIGGLGVGFLALELCLQGAAWYLAATRPPRVLPAPDATHRVLCLGDSNTYGLYVGPEHAYPARLAAAWKARHGPAIEVANAGYPGTSSSALRNRLTPALDTHRPQVVTIMVGANDGWTVPEPIPGEPVVTGWRLWRVSRVFRLLFTIMRAVFPASPGVAADSAPTLVARPEGTPGWTYALRRNLEVIAAEVRAHGAEPVLLTYPSGKGLYGDANAVIRATAKGGDIPLVDVTAAFAPRCLDWTCPELLPDQHPTDIGHDLVARTVAAALVPGAEPLAEGRP